MATMTRNKKTVRIELDDLKAFRKYVNGFLTLSDCSDDCGISIQSITRLLKFKTCAPVTLLKLKAKI
jgi:hypothetical protein